MASLASFPSVSGRQCPVAAGAVGLWGCIAPCRDGPPGGLASADSRAGGLSLKGSDALPEKVDKEWCDSLGGSAVGVGVEAQHAPLAATIVRAQGVGVERACQAGEE